MFLNATSAHSSVNNLVMRAYEFLKEQDHEQSARDALINILVTNHALGIPRVTVQQLADSLEERNFFMPLEWISQEARAVPVVDQEKSTESHIALQSQDLPSEEPEEPEAELEPDTERSVEQMAKRALAKRS